MDSSTLPRRTPTALLERLDQCERSTLIAIANHLMIPGNANVIDRPDLAVAIVAWLADRDRLDEGHAILDEMRVA